jgi:hypothetical protein
VFSRKPEDGLYPRTKAIHELTPDDIPELAKQSRWDTISKLIDEQLTVKHTTDLVNQNLKPSPNSLKS